MIVKGGPISNWGLGKHLTAEKNERVDLIGSRGVMGDTIEKAILDLDAQKSLMQAKKNLAHFHISPDQNLTDAQWQTTWARLEREYGLDASSYVEVQHTKEGRTHRHRVYSRLDPRTEKAVTFSHNFRRNEKIEHELAVTFGHEIVPGRHTAAIVKEWDAAGERGFIDAMRQAEEKRHERAKDVAPEGREDAPDTKAKKRAWSEHQQEDRTGRKLSEITAAIGAAWERTDGAIAFRAALLDSGLQLARGDRAGFVVVDEAGGIHSVPRALRRAIPGFEGPELKERLASIARALPNVDQAREYQRTGSPGPEIKAASSRDRTARKGRAARDTKRPAFQDVARIVGRAWSEATNADGFREQLRAQGLELAVGDRRGLVIIDSRGRIHGLARVLRKADPAIKASDIRDRFPGLEKDLPTVAQATDWQRQAAAARGEDFNPGPDRSGTFDGTMPRPDEVNEQRRERAHEAQQKRRAEEREARAEIHDLAEKRVKAEFAAYRQERSAIIQAKSSARWGLERAQRSKERKSLLDAERLERNLIFRGTSRGLVRTLALGLHRHLAKVSRNRLRKQQSERWTAAKRDEPMPARPMSYGEFLKHRSALDDVARWLRDRQVQREQYRAGRTEHSRDPGRQRPGQDRANPSADRADRPGPKRGPDRGG